MPAKDSRRRERFRERIDWIFEVAQVYRIDIEAARERVRSMDIARFVESDIA
jgi:hypothetical protein